MSFFEPSQNPQILFLFQFIQLFYSRRPYPRPISDLSYRVSFSKSYFSKFRNLLQILLLHNSTSKFVHLRFFLLKLCSCLSLYRRFLFLLFRARSSLLRYQCCSYLVLRVLNLTYLILRISCRRKLLSLAYLYILKLSYYSLPPVIVRYRSLSYPY